MVNLQLDQCRFSLANDGVKVGRVKIYNIGSTDDCSKGKGEERDEPHHMKKEKYVDVDVDVTVLIK